MERIGAVRYAQPLFVVGFKMKWNCDYTWCTKDKTKNVLFCRKCKKGLFFCRQEVKIDSWEKHMEAKRVEQGVTNSRDVIYSFAFFFLALFGKTE